MALSIYDRLGDFGTAIYTVGNDAPHGNSSKTDINKLTGGNIIVASKQLSNNPDGILVIAGGNGGEKGRRGDGIPGSFREAERSLEYIRWMIGEHILRPWVRERVMTDCDPEFQDRYQLAPSCNTIENARNVTAVLKEGRKENGLDNVEVVACIDHIGRVIGTLRQEMDRVGIFRETEHMVGYPVIAAFEESNLQRALQDRHAFARWEFAARMHHLLTGAVPRAEFVQEWIASIARRACGKGCKVRDDAGEMYGPGLLYPWLCKDPVDVRGIGMFHSENIWQFLHPKGK